MHRSWRLLSLAFIVLISVSSVCTFPVKTSPQLHSGGSPVNDVNTSSTPSNKVTFRWSEITRFNAPLTKAGELKDKLSLSESRIRDLMVEAADVLGLDKSPPPEVERVDEGGVEFEKAYRNGFVRFQILGGTKFAGKEVLGVIYVGLEEQLLRRWDAKILVDREEVFPNPQIHSGGSSVNDVDTSSTPSNKVTFRWSEITRFNAPLAKAGELKDKLSLSESRIRDLMVEAADVLGLDKSPPPKVERVDEGGVEFEKAYRNGFVRFQILGGTKFAGKEVLGVIYIGWEEQLFRRWDAKILVDREEVFPEKS
ncbi:hypothetical protein DFH05DRAFT_1508374 [Lentinula detonsa]|uniref:Uncharacterized protein n=1 Tax=Lentinula detonsa TaxID=2804962 RepID=A0A9W8NT38_9AGAR|nr:hypothetical protein DFH05DRAFT_1508374 [Lentinula detonsa]KAJ3982728.1 hypothetical protein F5890DRAFT_1555643 [Lentinula detonsa]